MFRDAEKQYLSAVKQQANVDNYLYLSKVYVKLDQPLNSLAKLKEANAKFPFEVFILQGIARIHEVRICIKFFYLYKN
jgi:tetratricopeptide repeat protein 8